MEKLAIVVPCYNEEEVLKIASEALRGVLDDLIRKGKIAEDSFILFVNDGSKDRTWELIEEEHQAHPVQVCGVKLAGNVGHQFALTAGLITAMDLSDVTVSIDADLQDDVAVIEEMIDKFHNGCDIVYGVRKERKTDTFFKRTTAQGFYKVMEMMGVKTVYNHADFRPTKCSICLSWAEVSATLSSCICMSHDLSNVTAIQKEDRVVFYHTVFSVLFILRIRWDCSSAISRNLHTFP